MLDEQIKHHSQSVNRTAASSDIDYKQKVMMEKERRKREEEERHIKQLDMIRQDNV